MQFTALPYFSSCVRVLISCQGLMKALLCLELLCEPLPLQPASTLAQAFTVAF